VPDHLTTVTRNAHALATRGDLRAAQAMLGQAIEPATTMLGPDHPEVLAATRLLASLHRDLGDLSGARRLLEEALAAGQFTLGDDSPALLPLSFDLATLADELGNRHEARRNFARLLRHGPAALGPDHEYVRAARAYLGVAGAPPGPAAAPPGPGPAAAPPVSAPPADPAPPAMLAPATPQVPPLPSAQPLPPPPWEATRFAATPATTPALPASRSPALPAPAAPPIPAVPAWPPLGAGYRHDEHRHSRVPMLALVLVAAMALVGGGIAAFLVLRAPGSRPAPQPAASATAGAPRPPGDLKLRDDGASITLTWVDPSNGTVPFVVAGGRANGGMNPLGTAESGKSTFTVHGISATADYCFLVAAVYGPERTVPSALACTQRTNATPSPRR
jgi:hypothetical protein